VGEHDRDPKDEAGAEAERTPEVEHQHQRNDREERAYLNQLVERLKDYPLVVELRHESWNDPRILQTLEDLHLSRDARLPKYARDGCVDVTVFVLVFTNEHEDSHSVVLFKYTEGSLERYSTTCSRRAVASLNAK
jgi:uncharacterized protein YecE (DUF72 family)